jgi:alkylation response protein AidB-like acyl-CoA dehydrogenase
VELAKQRGLTADSSTRQIIARTHINDHMQAQLTKRLTEATAIGAADATAASLIKLGMGISTPLRAAAVIEITGRRGIACAQGEPGEAAWINFLNGRIMSIAGGSNQIQRNIIGERLLAAGAPTLTSRSARCCAVRPNSAPKVARAAARRRTTG